MTLFYRPRNNPNPLAKESPLAGRRGRGGEVGANVEYPQWQAGTLAQALDSDPAMREVTKSIEMLGGKKMSFRTAVPDKARGPAPGLDRNYGTRGMGDPVYDRARRVKE